MKTVRRPPYPKWNPGYFPCSSLTPLPLSSRRPSVSFGGFGLSQSRPRLGCLAGTLSPSRRQIRSTRLWFTLHPSHCSIAATRRYPYRPYRLASRTTAIVRASSSSATVAVYLCVDRGCSSARQARRSEMPYLSPTTSTHLRRRAGLRSFPVLPPSESGCPTSGPLPHA